jgi:outer membrane murein-binding lipoprotein Lpp
MKKSSILIISLFTIFLLSGCTSKAQTDIIDSNSKDINDLMKTLIQKENHEHP